MNKKLFSLGLLSASLLSIAAVQANQDDAVVRSLRAQLEREVHASAAPSNTGFRFDTGNAALTFGGSVKAEYVRQHQTETFNKDLEDEHGFFSDRVDLNVGVESPGVEMGMQIRHKHKGGKFATLKADKTSFKVGDAVQEVDAASINHPLAWVKHLWLGMSLNHLAGRNAETDHSLKVGLFDWKAGRGISYGSLYGTQKKHLGVFSGRNDFAPWGINLSGELVKNRVAYDLYFGRLEEKSDSFEATHNRDMAHVVGRRDNPESGVGKSNDVLGARLLLHYDTLSLGDIQNEYYIVYNDASNQQVDMANDSKSELATVGSMLEFKNGDFEFGYEAALNFGHQDVYNIDRNVIALTNHVGAVGAEADNNDIVTADVQLTGPTYSHVAVNGVTPGAVNAAAQGKVDAYDSNFNSVSIGTVTAGGNTAATVANAANRYRDAYKNTYHGWMVVGDMTYNWRRANVKFHAAAGHASGDASPHDSATDKRYHGFIGLNENYAGSRVKSILVLNARKAQRPHINRDGKVLIDNSFTDLSFVGAGLEWKLAKRNIDVGVNVMGFFKDKAGMKYVYNPVADTGAPGTDKAAKFLGTEANMTFNWQLLPGLALAGEAALFLPGTYYNDITGTPMSTKTITKLDASDKSGYVQKLPRLSTDTAYHLNIGMQYTF